MLLLFTVFALTIGVIFGIVAMVVYPLYVYILNETGYKRTKKKTVYNDYKNKEEL